MSHHKEDWMVNLHSSKPPSPPLPSPPNPTILPLLPPPLHPPFPPPKVHVHQPRNSAVGGGGPSV